MNYKKLAVLAVGAVFAAQAAFADTGWLASYAYVWDGTDDTVYTLNGGFPDAVAGTPVGAFDDADLGTFNLGYTLFLNAEISAWADGGDEFTDLSLWYRVYDNTPGAFAQQSSSSIDNFGGNDWRGIATGVDLGGLGVGEYTVDIYVSRSHTWDAGTGGPFTTYLNTTGDTGGSEPTGDFFSASFEVIPEPGTMGLLVIGLLGAAGLRRRLS